MNYLSVCSGIEAATVAWEPIGFSPVAFSEIEPFACALLEEHYPSVPNLGDMTQFKEWNIEQPDVLVGGTPCQSYSVAGLRGGLADPRGSLMLTFGAIAGALRPTWIVWENVPGVLSSNGGRDFGSFLGMLAELGFGFAYRILDAQYIRVESHSRAVPQRRRRVFVVGYLGDWRVAAAVLFESASLQGYPPPSRETGARVADPITRAFAAGRGSTAGKNGKPINLITQALTGSNGGPDDNKAQGGFYVAHPLLAKSNSSFDESLETYVAATLGSQLSKQSHPPENNYISFDTTQITHPENRSNPQPGDPAPTLAKDGHVPAIAHALSAEGFDASEDGTGRGTPIVVDTNHVNQYGVRHGTSKKTRPGTVLRTLQKSIGEEAFLQWSVGIIAAFWPQEVLRSEMHGGGLRRETEQEHGLLNVSLSRAENGCSWSMRDVRNAGSLGRSPQGQGQHEQLAGELGAYLSKLPYAPSPAEVFMQDLREAYARSRILRKALSEIQEIRRSSCVQRESAHASSVRRLTPEEAEALQGFPRGYTAITYRGKPATDSPRYRAIGNSMAVNVMRWIGERIKRVNESTGGLNAREREDRD